MLNLIRQSNKYFRFSQNLVKGGLVNEACRYNEMFFKPAAYNMNNCCELVLYTCPRSTRNYSEAGILYGPGPAYEGSWKKFPMEMIQFFADRERLCFYLADEYFQDLVKTHNFSIEVGAAY